VRAICLPRVVVFAAVLAVAGLGGGCGSTRPAVGVSGAIASAAPDATAAGIAVLREGGNATDAAVAVALALAVVHPQAGNLGGGGFAVVRHDGEVFALDFRETAPAAARPDMYLGSDGEPLPGASTIGALAVGVPGSPAGYFELHRRFGRLPWRRVVDPAIRLARDGFVVTPRLAQAVEGSRERLARFPSTAAVWLPGGGPPEVGSRVRLSRLGALLADYSERGPAAITTGAAAEAIERASRGGGGVLTAADLAAYRAVWRAPLRFEAFGWQVAGMPLPSSGGAIVAQTCGVLKRLDWAALTPGSVERIHLLAEAWRRAFADRALLGDPGSTRARERDLLALEWLDRRALEIDRTRATPSAAIKPWSPAPPSEHGETTHLSVVDGEGNAVALTTTLNESFGCGVLVPELEMLLNNEMDDFATAPGRPNTFGLVQGEANAVAAGKRMLSSMAPTVAWRAGEVLALGAPGGPRIPTATVQVLLVVVVDGADLQDAVDRPRIHHQWLPDELVAEPGALSAGVRTELQRRGHGIGERKVIGEVDAARRTASGAFEAVADARGPGSAAILP